MSEFKRLKTKLTKQNVYLKHHELLCTLSVSVLCECVVNLMRLLCVWDCECILAGNYLSCQLGQLVHPPSSPLLTTPFPLLHISVCLGGGGMQVPYNTRTHTKYINKQIWWGQLNENNCRIVAKNTLSRLPEAIICRVVACRKSFNALLRCRCREAKKLSRAQLWSAPGQWCG